MNDLLPILSSRETIGVMKITYAVPVELDTPGGNVQHVLGICRHAAKSGIELKLICLKGKNAVPKEDFEIITMDSSGMGAIERVYKFSHFALKEIKKSQKPDWVYLRPFPLDYVFFTRHLKALKIPYAYELNTLWESELVSQGKIIKAKIYPWFESKSIKNAQALYPVTNEISTYAHSVGGSRIPTLVAGNGIEIPEPPREDKVQLRIKWKLPVDKKLVIMAGFSRPWHGYEKLIQSLPLLDKEIHIVLVGSESETVTTTVKSLADSVKVLDRVHILPWLDHTKVNELIFCSDIGVSPLALEKKNMKEAQSLKVRHYLALGIPVLLAGGEAQEILNSGYVLQIKNTSEKEIAEGIKNLAQKTFPTDEVRRFAISNLSWESISRKTWNFLKEIKYQP